MTSRKFAKLFGLAAVAAGAVVMASGAASAADYTMKIGLATFKDVQHEWANRLKAAVEAKSGGRIEVQVFPKSQLGPIPRQIEGVQLGTIEAFVAPTDFFSGIDSRFGVFSIPAVFRDKPHAAKTLQDPALNKAILAMADDKGIDVVSVFPHSTAHYFAKEPIRRLADFKGKKLRINATAAEREKMRRLGATAVPMPLSEVVPSLQRGVIDGTMSAPVIYVVFKYNEMGKVLTQTNDTLIISAGIVSKAWLAKLPADLQQVVIDEAAALQAPITAFSDVQEQAMVDKWKELGGELNPLPADEMTRIKSMLADVGEQVTKSDASLAAFFNEVRAAGKMY